MGEDWTLLNEKTRKRFDLSKVQALWLEIIKRTKFNQFDGKRIVQDLLFHRNLWEGCILIRGLEIDVKHHLPIEIEYMNNDLITLRDISNDFWNADELYILTTKKDINKLKYLAKKWEPDEISVISKEETENRLGSWPSTKKVLRLWWD